jgi:hypothetical protein
VRVETQCELHSYHLLMSPVVSLLAVEASARLLPADFSTESRDRVNGVEGLCIVLRRLAFPSRWMDLVPVFGRQKGTLSRIFLHTMTLLMSTWGHLLNFNPVHFVHRLPFWARSIARKGSPHMMNIVLFLDGTLRETTRPGPSPTKLPPGVTLNMLQVLVNT